MLPTSDIIIVISPASEDEVEEIRISVMTRDMQDPALYKIYEGLPHLRSVSLVSLSSMAEVVASRFCDVQPYSQYGTCESRRVGFSGICELLDDSARR
jgi:hypothetical protein